MINELAKIIHENNKAKGFYDQEKNIGEIIALIHSEVSEALECDRKGRYARMIEWGIIKQAPTEDDEKQYFEEMVKDTFEDELADIMIRVMDLAAYKGVDLDNHIIFKLRYNKMRPYKHGKKY